VRCLLTILSVLVITGPLRSQPRNEKWLVSEFKNADSILLISHEPTMGSTDDFVDSSSGKSIDLPKLIIKCKLNRQIIKEEKVIHGSEIDTLLKILIRPEEDSIIYQGGCFRPRQSIILLKNHKTSYIDICFHCGSYEVSKDLNEIPEFDNQRWDELEAYFRRNGLTYELDDVIP
jgi:hypothetical protein